MEVKTIAAQDVRPGHELYNLLAPHPAYRWSWVREVSRHNDQITLVSQCFTTVKHAREGVFVRVPEVLDGDVHRASCPCHDQAGVP